MDDIQATQNTQTDDQKAAHQDIPVETKLLSETIIELNISRKNISIYPTGHAQIDRCLTRTHNFLNEIFNTQAEFTLGVAKDTLFVGDAYLDPKNPVYREYAISLNQHDIAAVSFINGVDREELLRFQTILTTKPESLRSSGGIEKIITKDDFPHIRIQAIDYSRFRLTEEREISRPQGRHIALSETDIWQDFASSLISGSAMGSQRPTPQNQIDPIGPSSVAQFINAGKLDSEDVIKQYDRIIQEHIHDIGEKKQEKITLSATVENLNKLIKDLRPELRKQFLSATFGHLSSKNKTAAGELLKGFSTDTILEMIRHANEEGREISPTLMNLMENISRTDPSIQYGSDSPESAPEISDDQMETLFDREEYETHIDSEYDDMLKHLNGETDAGPSEKMGNFSIDDYIETLEDRYLDFQISRAFLAFIEEDIEAEDYNEISQNLIALVPVFFENGEFSLLLELLETFRRHSKNGRLPEIKILSKKLASTFKSPDFILTAVAAFDRWATIKGSMASDFLLSIGPDCLPRLINRYATENFTCEKKMLTEVISDFGQAGLIEVKKQLNNPKANVVRNLVILVRTIGMPEIVPFMNLKKLAQHPDHGVRLEVLMTLLYFKDPYGTELLKKDLNSKDKETSMRAIVLAGQFRVWDIAKDLSLMIKKNCLFRSDYAVNEEIIKALGKIGNDCAIPVLDKCLRVSLTLYPDNLRHMKETILESLNGYPENSMADLLKIWVQSKKLRFRKLQKNLREKE